MCFKLISSPKYVADDFNHALRTKSVSEVLIINYKRRLSVTQPAAPSFVASCFLFLSNFLFLIPQPAEQMWQELLGRLNAFT